MPCIPGTARRSAWLKGKVGGATGGHTGSQVSTRISGLASETGSGAVLTLSAEASMLKAV